MRIWGPLAALCLGTFMLLIDVTIVLAALPSLSGSLGSSLSQLQWVADGYALAVAAALLGAGMLADRHGRRRVYAVGLVVFASASVACALSPDMGWLIAARLVQGVGAAAMFTTTLSLISTLYSGRRLGLAYGVWAAVASSASALGPILGGLLTQALNWRWIFYVNVPVTALALVMTFRCIPRRTPDRDATRRLDVPGVVLCALGAGGCVYALTASHAHGWASAGTLVPLAVALVACAVFVAVQRRSTHPLLDLSLFRRPEFTAAMITIAVGGGAVYGVLPYTSLWLQSVQHLSPIGAGLVVLPHAAAAGLVAVLSGRWMPKPSPRLGATLGLLLAGLGVAAEGFLGPGSGWPALIGGLALSGIGMGLVFQVAAALALGSVPPERAGMAGGAYSTFEQLGYAFGVAVFGTLAVSTMNRSLNDVVPDPENTAQTLSGGGADTLLAATPAGARSAFGHTLHSVFATAHNTLALTAGALAITGAALVLRLTRRRPNPPKSAVAGSPAKPAAAAQVDG
ncbi:DHA2 family efflux MFS transporter permease subunit [Streptomyces decoyicus]|uniref:DHA2 family efflux MFS transporter permease subunit n=1 Tax=Streptomyces decoyicus TaxID=249567 RepID=A0ABZ1F9W5_9ACTN|nr:DHA2 family efflux MFS transporter permease subunit [Streptomyces decoyicus]WSB66820.1 DHA2 family efflux MFS transporter permease subunit [Streptomyces decoyicus]